MLEFIIAIDLEEELTLVGDIILKHFSKNNIVLLKGNLGAGKTTFVKSFAKKLGCMQTIQSPTYSIVNEYKTEDGKSIAHFDLYRIKNAAELINIGFEDYLYNNDYCFIEWYEIAESILPINSILVDIEVFETKRSFLIKQLHVQ